MKVQILRSVFYDKYVFQWTIFRYFYILLFYAFSVTKLLLKF